MDFLSAAKYRYYGKDDSQNILQKVNREIHQNMSACEHELLCIMNEVISLEPCCYWNRHVFNQTDAALQSIATQLPTLSIDDTIFEFFLSGYNAYMQVTNVINDLSGLNDSPAMKNRQFRIPTYVSIVEGCLTNLYRFIALIINQTTTKDYASTYKLNPLCEILNKNGFDKLTESVNINIRNAINHGGIVFEEDGQKIVFHYTENKRSVSSTFTAYEFDQLINDVYDTASAIILGITVFLNLNWKTVTVDRSSKTFVAFCLLGMELSIPTVRCRYISESPSGEQLNAEFWVKDTERGYLFECAVLLVMAIYDIYDGYEKYYISFSGERLATSWMCFSNQQVFDMLNRNREPADIIKEVINSREVVIFNPSTEPIDLQEIKHFRFPNYQCDTYKISQIEDASLPDRKRLKCRLYIGDIDCRETIIKIIEESIEWLKKIRNVDSPTIHRKNGTMEADALYITIYRRDARRNKGLLPSNENFIGFVDYNLSGETTLLNGGLPAKIWAQFHHEKIGKIAIAWREGKYMTRHSQKVGANDPCPCGSGKKFKKCCRGKDIFD